MNKFVKNSKTQDVDYRQIHWAEYYLPNGTTVYVGNRPGPECTSEEFFNKVDGFMNVTDRLVQYPKGKSACWFPWNEAGFPSYETIFGVLKTLNYWVQSPDFNHIYLHCDGGTHRAVTMFGLYIRAYHENYEEINKNHKLVGRKTWSNPLEYSAGYLKDIPELQELIDTIAKLEDSFEWGGMLEAVITQIGEKKLSKYRAQRFYHQDMLIFYWLVKSNIKSFFTYTLFKTPYAKLRIKFHKFFNTKRGKWYKKHNF